MATDRGPYVQYDGLPPLHPSETGLPLLHPYASVNPGRYITAGGGRLTIEETTAHHRIALDHLGCDAQVTGAKDDAYKRLALAAEGHCLRAGCKHRAAFTPGVYRRFEIRRSSIQLSAFVRALLAIELADFKPADRLAAATAKTIGEPR